MNVVAVLSGLSPDEAVRNAATAALEDMEGRQIERRSRSEVLAVLLGVPLDDAGSVEPADAHAARLLIRAYVEAGGGDGGRTVAAMRKDLAELSTQFMANLADDESTIELSARELEGLSDAFVSGLQPAAAVAGSVADSGAGVSAAAEPRFEVPLDYEHVSELLDSAVNPAVRRRVAVAEASVAAVANTALLVDMLRLRRDIGASRGKGWGFLLALFFGFVGG